MKIVAVVTRVFNEQDGKMYLQEFDDYSKKTIWSNDIHNAMKFGITAAGIMLKMCKRIHLPATAEVLD